jgi:hypothetical protein
MKAKQENNDDAHRVSRLPLWKRHRALLAFFAGALLGPGVVWQYLSQQTDERSLELEKLRTSTDTRQRISDLLLEAFQLRNTVYQLWACDPGDRALEVNRRVAQANERTQAIVDDLTRLEAGLAAMEGRPSRSFSVAGPAPPAPTDVLSLTFRDAVTGQETPSVTVERSPRQPCLL